MADSFDCGKRATTHHKARKEEGGIPLRAVVTADLHYDLLAPASRAGLRAWVDEIIAAQLSESSRRARISSPFLSAFCLPATSF